MVTRKITSKNAHTQLAKGLVRMVPTVNSELNPEAQLGGSIVRLVCHLNPFETSARLNARRQQEILGIVTRHSGLPMSLS